MRDVNYFINKFEAIPENAWITGDLLDPETGACCALGHCGVRESKDEGNPKFRGGWVFTDESDDLISLFGGSDDLVWFINDSRSNGRADGSTPKERILNYLYEVRKENEVNV